MDLYIFDLDYTLLIPDWSREDDYFKEQLSASEFAKLMEMKQPILNEYESKAAKYDLASLSAFYKSYGIDLPTDIIEGWMIHNGNTITDVIAEGALELLDYLKSHNKKIALLSNWFSVTQIMRLKRSDLYDYFDAIICGDQAMKPTKESFALCVKDIPKEKCIMIGDDPKKDYQGAIDFGINAYLVDKEHTLTSLLNDIKNNHILTR